MLRVSDEELVRSLARGREEALEVLLARHEGRVRRLLARRLPRREDVEEAAQDVFLKIHRAAATFRESGRFLPWLRAIARNVAVDRLRRRPRIRTEPLLTDPLEGVEVHERGIRAEEVRAALARLPREYRAALVLRYLAGASYAEGARELGLSPRGFETRLARARVLLRRILAGREEPPHGLR